MKFKFNVNVDTDKLHVEFDYNTVVLINKNNSVINTVDNDHNEIATLLVKRLFEFLSEESIDFEDGLYDSEISSIQSFLMKNIVQWIDNDNYTG